MLAPTGRSPESALQIYLLSKTCHHINISISTATIQTIRKLTNSNLIENDVIPFGLFHKSTLDLCKFLHDRSSTSDTHLAACCNVCQSEYPNPSRTH